MAIKYYSKEWFEEMKKRTASDQVYLSKGGKDLTYKSVYLLTDCPGGVDKQAIWTLENGILVDYKLEEKPAPSDWRTQPFDDKTYLMGVTGSYETYAKMNRKEITAMQALMQKVYKIDGPMPKIMTVMTGINSLADVMSSIPVDYD